MTRSKRRLIWGAGLVAVLLVGAALYVYFVGTRTLLEHAEAFSFRRMTVAQPAGQGGYRLFYATNRIPDDADGPIEDRRFTDTGLPQTREQYFLETPEGARHLLLIRGR